MGMSSGEAKGEWKVSGKKAWGGGYKVAGDEREL